MEMKYKLAIGAVAVLVALWLITKATEPEPDQPHPVTPTYHQNAPQGGGLKFGDNGGYHADYGDYKNCWYSNDGYVWCDGKAVGTH
ncbi:hypothetical protein [Nocardia bovistercoris]|uniref:Uncharacterized protein n=1 Tax=Nocardia bovistercoris TaxID=2785916 RepID=A0A931IJP6_9NOCA|nr:hypothetical protein [Nocardia bovistercoris]MBH0781873.1 hypothetical protein [Nocardia bovistercoris]